MGVDLELRPVVYRDEWRLCDTLSVHRNSELWPFINDLPMLPVPNRVFQESETTDEYGIDLAYTTAGMLCSLKERPEVKDPFRNRAIWAYLAELPEDWPVMLYWC